MFNRQVADKKKNGIKTNFKVNDSKEQSKQM